MATRKLKPLRGDLSQSEFDSLIKKYEQGLPLTSDEDAALEDALGFVHTGPFEGRPEYKEVLDNYLSKQKTLGQKKAIEELKKDKKYDKIPKKDFNDFIKRLRNTSKTELERVREQNQKTQRSLRNITETGRKDALRREDEYRQRFDQSYERGQRTLQEQKLRYGDYLRRSRTLQGQRQALGIRNLGEFRARQGDTLARWRSVYGREMADLNRIGDEQQLLMEEVMEAPSSVEQQARQNYDRQLQQAAAMAALSGRGVSGQGQALRDMVTGGNARIFGETAGLRSQEYLQRLGMRGDMLNQQRDLSQRRSQLGLSDVDVNRKQGLDAMAAYNTVQNQLNRTFEEEGRLYDAGRLQAQQNLGYETEMMRERRLAWTQSAEIMSRLRQEQYNAEEFGYRTRERETDRTMDLYNAEFKALQARTGIDQQNILNQMSTDRFNRQGDLTAYNLNQQMIQQQEALNRMRAEQERQRVSSLFGTTIQLGGAVLGGLVGGPAGASLGGSLGGTIGGMFGGGSGAQQIDFGQLYNQGRDFYNQFRGSAPSNPNLVMGRPVPTNTQPGGLGSTSIGGF